MLGKKIIRFWSFTILKVIKNNKVYCWDAVRLTPNNELRESKFYIEFNIGSVSFTAERIDAEINL